MGKKRAKDSIVDDRDHDNVSVSVTINDEKYTYGVKVPRVFDPEVHIPVAIRQNMALIMDKVMQEKPWT